MMNKMMNTQVGISYHMNHIYMYVKIMDSGLDPDYVQYIKSKREKEYEVERRLGTDQRQSNVKLVERKHSSTVYRCASVNSTLDSMKTSLSYINTKLASNAAGGSLSELEISQLQDRLAATEAQMYQIINALDAASTKVQELSKMNLPLQGTERKVSQYYENISDTTSLCLIFC